MTTKSSMTTKPDFVLTLVGLIASVLIVVATAAFVFIPYSLSGHPGETTIHGANTTEYHPT
jgi:hypothetical protein